LRTISRTQRVAWLSSGYCASDEGAGIVQFEALKSETVGRQFLKLENDLGRQLLYVIVSWAGEKQYGEVSSVR